MDNSLFNRTELLLGREAMERIRSKRVIIFGVGGVSSLAWGALGVGVRSAWCVKALST